MDSVMTFFEALFTFLFGVALPSWDVYSDLYFALTLIIPRCNHINNLVNDYDSLNKTACTEIGEYYGHPNFAIAMLMPVLLTMLFILPHWWHNEKKTPLGNKIFTFALVLLQFYPQWKMLNVIYIGFWKKDANWKEEKENLLRNVGGLGKFLKNMYSYLYLNLHYRCISFQNPS